MFRQRTAVLCLLVMTCSLWAAAASYQLNAVTYPERRNIDVAFSATGQAPRGALEAEVEFEEGQAYIEFKFENMKPAVLFGGDITCYVVWAVSRDSSHENLGELWMPESKGKHELSTGRKSFALIITAEAHPLVRKPSQLVMFISQAVDNKRAENAPFEFSDFAEPAEHDMESIANIAWDSTVPIDVVQAEKAYELAQRMGAADYAAVMMRDAKIALGQSRNLAAASKTKQRIDYSRRSIASSSEAIQTTVRRKEAEELERQIAARRAEMEALDERARAAEQKAADAELALAKAQAAITEANVEKARAQDAVQMANQELARLATEKQALEEEKATLNSSMAVLRQEGEELRAETAQLRTEQERLKKEREELANRLQGALSMVAETRDSARGFIVNLPDILFDVNKATLKHEAQLVIAKIAGILLIMPELNLRIEGHTDSQGSDEYNQRLSEQRADSVKDFLERNGINNSRMKAVGYGESQPIADNDSASGRQQNRRVEIIIGEGEIAAAGD